MGGLFDYTKRAPAVPAPMNGASQEYHASAKAWTSQTKRVKNCATSIELLYKDITRLNLLLRFLKSPHNDLVLKMRLFTAIDMDSKISKLLWKFNNNTIIRCDVVNIKTLPPLSIKDKAELSRPSHPHHTPGAIHHENNNNNHQNKNKKDIKIVIEASYVLQIYEFYYLFLFLEDKLPELALWLMKQSQHNEQIQQNVLLNVINRGNDNKEEDNEEEDKEEEKKEIEYTKEMMIEQQQMIKQNIERNEIEDDHCIICFEKMSNPMVLKCSHEFCKICIEDWQKEIGGKDCPICRCIIEQSQMWVKLDSQDFSKAQYMLELLKFPFQYVKNFEKWEDAMIK